MKVIDSIPVTDQYGSALIELCHGDLTEMGPGAEVDILVISAFPSDYVPTAGTLIGALYDKRISVAKLAANKAADQSVPIPAMLAALVRAAYRWIKFGLPIRTLQIVERSATKVGWIANEFALVKKSITQDAEAVTATEKKAPRRVVRSRHGMDQCRRGDQAPRRFVKQSVRDVDFRTMRRCDGAGAAPDDERLRARRAGRLRQKWGVNPPAGITARD